MTDPFEARDVVSKEAVRARLEALPARASAAFALACAGRLARRARADGAAGASLALRAVECEWNRLCTDTRDCAALRAELVMRDDIDADHLAAALYALDAAAGSPQAAAWAADRAMDAAFERVAATYTGPFRPVEQDAAEPPVRGEAAWQRATLDLLERHGLTAEVAAELQGDEEL